MPAPMVLAVEGGSFSKEVGGQAVMAILLTEGILPKLLTFEWVEVDGLDATEKLLHAITRLGCSADIIISDSVPIAGFNMIDARALVDRTGSPAVFVLPERPDGLGVSSALRKHFPDWRRRRGILAAAGEPAAHQLGDGTVFLECVGIGSGAALRILRRLTVFGKVPEPIRLARMAAREAGRLVGPR